MVIDALALALSTEATADPVPPVDPAVKVAEASPLDWMVACVPDRLPSTALPQVTGKLISWLIWAVVRLPLAELCKKSAVRVDV